MGANMRRVLIIGAFLLVAVSVGVAKEDNKDYPVAGWGSLTCAEFANFYRMNPTAAQDGAFNWAQGFMSGLNAAQMQRDGAQT